MNQKIKFAQKDIVIDNLNIHTESFGDRSNPVCLLIAGAMAPARFWSDEFCKNISDSGFFVIRYDHRDIGESGAVDWTINPYTLKELAHDAVGILDAYAIDKAHCVGHSMGGYICQELALDFPERVNSITIISAGPIGATTETETPLTEQEQKIFDTTWSVFLARKDSANFEDTVKGYMNVWRYLNGTVAFDEQSARSYTIDLLKRTKHEIKAGNNHELVMRAVHENLAARKNSLNNITVPALVIHGQQDPLVLPRNMRAIGNAIKKSHGELIAGMGHVFFNKDIELRIADLVINHMKIAVR